jgi:hypothetical protein
MKREDLEIIRDFKYVNEDGHYVLTKEQLYKLTDKIQALEMKTEQEKLTLSKEDWDLLVKKLGSIISKAAKMELLRSNSSTTRIRPHSQIKDKALECLDIIKYKEIKK